MEPKFKKNEIVYSNLKRFKDQPFLKIIDSFQMESGKVFYDVTQMIGPGIRHYGYSGSSFKRLEKDDRDCL